MAVNFTFWENMKRTLDAIEDESNRLEAYEAIVEIGLTKDESIADNLSKEVKPIVIGLLPSLLRNYSKEQSERGMRGGAKEKNIGIDYKEIILKLYAEHGKAPTKKAVIAEIIRSGGQSISERTLERKGFTASRIKELCLETSVSCRDNLTNATNENVVDVAKSKENTTNPTDPTNDMSRQNDKTTNENVAFLSSFNF